MISVCAVVVDEEGLQPIDGILYYLLLPWLDI